MMKFLSGVTDNQLDCVVFLAIVFFLFKIVYVRWICKHVINNYESESYKSQIEDPAKESLGDRMKRYEIDPPYLRPDLWRNKREDEKFHVAKHIVPCTFNWKYLIYDEVTKTQHLEKPVEVDYRFGKTFY